MLGQDLLSDSKSQIFKCDKHFGEEYILRKGVINIPGQKPFASERKKITLKRDALLILHKNNNQETPSISTPINENGCKKSSLLRFKSIIFVYQSFDFIAIVDCFVGNYNGSFIM